MKHLLLGVMLLWLSPGCSDADENITSPTVGASTGQGVLVPPWSEHCVMTFTGGMPIEDGFGDLLFTAKAGDVFLVNQLDFFDVINALYLTEYGPVEFEVAMGTDLPITMNCVEDETSMSIGVFVDVTVFRDEGLTDEACQLKAGTTASASEAGYYLVSELNLSGPATYEVSLGELSSYCGDLTTGYIQVAVVEVLGSFRTPVPIRSFRSQL